MPNKVVVFFLLALGIHGSLASAATVKGDAAAPVASTMANTPVGFTYATAPVPAWVVAPAPVAAPALARSAMHYELVDSQMRIEGPSATTYFRQVRVIDESAGMGPAAQIEMEFDPAYQKLTMHHISILRGTALIDKLNRQKIQLLQRETQLDARAYNGRVTASIVLDDVRIGDRIDFDYSIQGSNPVFDGRAAATEWMLVQKGPAALFHFRVLAPADRVITIQPGALVTGTTTVHDGLRDARFVRSGVAQWQNEPEMPPSAAIDTMVQVSEFSDWSDVGRWGSKLFSPALIAAPAVHREADAISRGAATPQEKLLAALTFVQRDIRYFGTELGQSSHRPALPAKVLEQRFGDCKDKVSLLIALLRELGIDAEPVLVSMTFQEDLQRLLPSPLAFDHVIARVRLDDKVYWLDGTRNFQTGGLALRQSTGLGKGLVLRSDSPLLVDLPSADNELRIDVQDVLRVARLDMPPVLESRITYYGVMAEYIRAGRAALPQAQSEALQREPYTRLYPKLQDAAALQAIEEPGANALTIVQQFTLPDFWRFPEERVLQGEFLLWNVYQMLRSPSETTRTQPYRHAFPGNYKHSVVVELPADILKAQESQPFLEANDFFTLRTTYEATARRAAISANLQVDKPMVAAAQWSAYQAALVKTRPRTNLLISFPPLTLADKDRLMVALKELDKTMANGPRATRPTTRIQAESQVREVILSAELDSGMLTPAHRAVALAKRGVQRDQIDKVKLAAADFKEAVSLAQDNAVVLSEAAANATLNAEDAQAVELAERALKLLPGDSTALLSLATARYFKEDYHGAATVWNSLLAKRAEVERGYALVWLYLATRHTGADTAAALATYQRSPDGSADWPRPVVDWLLGKSTLDQTIAKAKGDGKDASRLCEAYYFAGERFLADGDVLQAKEYFQKAVNTNIIEFREYAFAKRRLAMLDPR
ncbi:lipoprotein NlpI/transglutaminase-like putative cysteine protease [Actimicrobium sp. GrIS 1.19]|uniref:DUF3857 domain-containing protein n=1 Tax=Actimicrobium sp. GrIS 1.19 TaxID=3071708 RepID=UPI002DFD325C|nr:lipoprotein NlpI/transglutaminase-like putative cysteine protease [Actimicrobium sp. GrIS 1.19]